MNQEIWNQEISKTAEETGDLIGNKIVDNITSASKKKSTQELHNNDETEEDVEIAAPKKRCKSVRCKKVSRKKETNY